jgi:hypothetical protein
MEEDFFKINNKKLFNKGAFKYFDKSENKK